jgi:exonuclease I
VLDANVPNVSSVSKIHKIFDGKKLCLKAYARFNFSNEIISNIYYKVFFVKKKI